MGKAAVIGGDVVVYEEKKGRVRLEVRLVGETVCLSPTQIPTDTLECAGWNG